MGGNKTCWGFVPSESNTKSTLRRSVLEGRHAVDSEPAMPPFCSCFPSSDLLVRDLDHCLTFPHGVRCTHPPNPMPVLCECNPETDPEPPDTVDEGNTELPSPTTRRSRNDPSRRKMQIWMVERLLVLMQAKSRPRFFRKPQRQLTCRIREGREGIWQRGRVSSFSTTTAAIQEPSTRKSRRRPSNCALLCFPTKLICQTEFMNPLEPSLRGVSRSLDLSRSSNNFENDFRLVRCC